MVIIVLLLLLAEALVEFRCYPPIRANLEPATCTPSRTIVNREDPREGLATESGLGGTMMASVPFGFGIGPSDPDSSGVKN